MIKIEKKKKLVLVGLLGLVLCFGVVNTKLNNQQDLSTSAEYTSHEMEEIAAHDGDVLVDSLNITAIPGTGPINEAGASASAINATKSAVVTSDDISDLSNADLYFEEIRATINMDRNQIVSMLSEVIKETESTAEKDNATQQKMKLIGYMEQEQVVENLIKTKGLPESFVLITDSAVNITMNKQEITKSDVAKVVDIVIRETNRPAGEIVIQSKY